MYWLQTDQFENLQHLLDIKSKLDMSKTKQLSISTVRPRRACDTHDHVNCIGLSKGLSQHPMLCIHHYFQKITSQVNTCKSVSVPKLYN